MYMFQMKEKVTHMLCHEMKGSRVRVTYLAAALKVNWTLSGGPGFSWIRREGPDSWALNSRFEGRKK